MAYNLERLQVLLVEDNLNMRALLRSILNAFGISGIRDVQNGEQAINELAHYTPDIVITDWVMEPVDGIALSRFIRADDHSPDIFLPIIMVTGHTQEWRVLQARDAGVTEFLAKPITAGGLAGDGRTGPSMSARIAARPGSDATRKSCKTWIWKTFCSRCNDGNAVGRL